MAMIPGSHNASVPLPRNGNTAADALPVTEVICGEPGTALMFHQGVYHRARTTPLRRALVGEWTRPEQPFGMGYTKPPFEDA
jgi:ectoine hydroxylase